MKGEIVLLLIFIMNLITLLIFIAIGVVSLKYHSKFPDTSIGYHFSWAVKDEDIWILANKAVGILCIVPPSFFFGMFAVVFYVISIDIKLYVYIYILEIIICTLLVLFLPKSILSKRYPDYFKN